jgi:hypothetical protein
MLIKPSSIRAFANLCHGLEIIPGPVTGLLAPSIRIMGAVTGTPIEASRWDGRTMTDGVRRSGGSCLNYSSFISTNDRDDL